MEEAQIQILIDAAVAAALEAAGAAPGAPAHPPAIATFARTPAQFNAGILNYGTSEGMKVYQAATAALTTRYNGKSNDMHIFLKNVKERAQLSGWEDILNIPKDGGTKNVIDEYGLIDLDDIRAHATDYENEAGRNAQNATQMYTFLSASMTDEAKSMVLSDVAEYTIITTAGVHVSNGPCFLKVLIRNTTVDTRSTIFHIRENLNHLEAKMLEVSYDIDAFNLYVTNQVEQLSARGETSSDLLINLFAAFLAVPDKKFVEYIEKQKDKYDEGEDITTKKLMQVALIKYKDRKRSDMWQAPSPEEEQIMALTAQVGELQKQKGSAKPTSDKPKKKKGGIEKTKTTTADHYSGAKYAWKLVPPANGEPKTKEVNKKTYHFCPHHNEGAGLWVIHSPAKCDRREEKKDTPNKDKTMSLTKVLQAIKAENEDESSDEDEE
jgi:hypothetical protein